MVLVTSDDRPRVPRVGPKVFADVPSSAEVQDLKRSRGQFFLISVILFVLLIAAGIAAAALWDRVGGDQGAVERLEGDLAKAKQDNVDLRAQFQTEARPFVGLLQSRAENQAVVNQIAARIREESRAVEALRPNGAYNTYLRDGGVWNRAENQSRTQLAAEKQALDRELEAVRAYRRPIIEPAPAPAQRF